MISKTLKDFIRIQSLAGFLIIAALIPAVLILVLAPQTAGFWHAPLVLTLGPWTLTWPLGLWVNEISSTLIFLLMVLELKRGLGEDEFLGADRLRLPLFAAVGGLVLPLAIFTALNWANPNLATGWSVPLGSDLALGLGILALFGDRVPTGLKLFFLTTCLFMNAGTLVLLASAHSLYLSWPTLAAIGLCLLLLTLMNLGQVTAFSLYALLGFVLWIILLAAGAPTALAGLFLALAIPVHVDDEPVLEKVEHDLHRVVGLVVWPLLFFVNMVALGQGNALVSSWSTGVALALFLGKPLGILTLCALGTRAGLCALPPEIEWRELGGAALLCACGGSMSLCWNALSPSSLAVETGQTILLASTAAATVGILVLKFSLDQRRNKMLQRPTA